MNLSEIVAQCIQDAGTPGSAKRFNDLMETLPPHVQEEVWGRLTDTTPNPTGDR